MVLMIVIALLGLVAAPSVAWAHGGGETEEGYLLVQQALGHLAHDTTHVGIALAMEKVNDALGTDDQDGVDVPEVEEGKGALQAGDADTARDLLQDSIKQALHDQPAATGYETGTKIIVPEFPGRSSIGGQGWSFLAASVAVLLIGLGLAFRFRPADSIGDLRQALVSRASGEDSGTAGPTDRAGQS